MFSTGILRTTSIEDSNLLNIWCHIKLTLVIIDRSCPDCVYLVFQDSYVERSKE